MSDTSERVGAVDGDALISKLSEWEMKAAMWAAKDSKVAVGEKQTCQGLTRLIREGRFALKPEASQETKWEKLKAWLNLSPYQQESADWESRVLSKMAELEDAELERVRKERDYTPEEAFAECKRRWGTWAFVYAEAHLTSSGHTYEVGYGSSRNFGNSFRAAFAEADKKTLKGGEA